MLEIDKQASSWRRQIKANKDSQGYYHLSVSDSQILQKLFAEMARLTGNEDYEKTAEWIRENENAYVSAWLLIKKLWEAEDTYKRAKGKRGSLRFLLFAKFWEATEALNKAFKALKEAREKDIISIPYGRPICFPWRCVYCLGPAVTEQPLLIQDERSVASSIRFDQHLNNRIIRN